MVNRTNIKISDRRGEEQFVAANNSNGSDKSSLIGDYGGTHNVLNPSNNHSRKAN